MSNSRASSLIENSVRSVSSIHMVGCTRFYMGSSGMGEAEELSKVYHDVAERSSKLLGEFAQKQAQGMSSAVRDEMGIAKAFMDLYARMAADPSVLATFSMNMWMDYARLWQSGWMKALGIDAKPVAEAAQGDLRFKDQDWSANFLFDYIKQSYLIAARHIQGAVSQVGGLPPESERKVAFFTRQYVDALAPSNFVLSWVNPDASLAQKGFDDYMLEGPLAALDAVEKATGERTVNFIGYCLGGTLLGATLAYLTARKDERVRSATYFVSLLDFSLPGELGVFIDEEQVANLERKMNSRGYLEGSEMAGSFNLLRANDLVWSFVVNNYLLGKDPFPFDLLYWNADSTRMPARMHSFYLRNMYIKNLLGVPGGIELAGSPIDLSRVKTPSYFISTVEDHIAPWKGTYRGARCLGGMVRFVLGGSGHTAGIVNHPAAKKYHYWTNDNFPPTPEEWLAGATQRPGSWWDDWRTWVDRMNGAEKVSARAPGEGKLKPLEDAPGSYAMLRTPAKVK